MASRGSKRRASFAGTVPNVTRPCPPTSSPRTSASRSRPALASHGPRDVPNELFLNDVLPYAILDEKRESWRPMLLELTAPIVAESKTASEAVQAINRQLYDKIKVHYNTGRKRPNACATESIEQGRATCTGLTILLVEACRSVGIPARACGRLPLA